MYDKIPLGTKVLYRGEVYILQSIEKYDGSYTRYRAKTMRNTEIKLYGIDCITVAEMEALKTQLVSLVQVKDILQECSARHDKKSCRVYIKSLENTVSLSRGICGAVPLHRLALAKQTRDAFDGWNCHYGQLAYPIGGKREFDHESRRGTIWLNNARWNAVDFLISECDRIIRLITFTKFK